MEEIDKQAFGRRLEDELSAQGWDIQTLQTQLRQRIGKARGTSYGAVWSYVKGEAPAQPRREIVEAMAELFSTPVARVRPDYLLYGGPRTETEEEAEKRLESSEGAELYNRVREEVPGLSDLDHAVAVALMTHQHRWVQAHSRAGYAVTVDEAVDYVVWVWNLLHEPLRKWSREIGRVVPTAPSKVSDYMMAMLHGLNLSLQIAAPPGISPEDVEEWEPLPDEENPDSQETTDG